MKPIPTIQKYIATIPHTIRGDQTLDRAQKLMRDHHIRHLPVLSGGTLIGLLSERDVRAFRGSDPTKLQVADACAPNPCIVAADDPLVEVYEKMTATRSCCVLVCDNHRLVGTFSWTDAQKALNECYPLAGKRRSALAQVAGELNA